MTDVDDNEPSMAQQIRSSVAARRGEAMLARLFTNGREPDPEEPDTTEDTERPAHREED